MNLKLLAVFGGCITSDVDYFLLCIHNNGSIFALDIVTKCIINSYGNVKSASFIKPN